jgi:type II secretion system protein N
VRDTVKQSAKDVVAVWAPRIALPITYVVLVAVFFVWTFPFDRLKERIVVAFNQQQRATNSNQELQIDELGSWWITGITAKGVHLVTASSDPKVPPTDMVLDEGHARVSLWPLLIGNKDVSFKVDAFGGEASGSFDDKGSTRNVDVDLDGLDLSQIAILKSAIEVPLEGRLSGKVKLDMPDEKASKGSGTITLTATDVTVGDGKKTLKAVPIAVPKLNVGTLTFEGEANEGVMKITKVSASGGDLDVQGEGKLSMRELATDSIADIYIRFKVSEAFRDKNDLAKTLFGDSSGKMPASVEMLDPRMKQAKRADGFYGFHLHGALGKLQFDPSAYSGQSGGGAPPPSAKPAPGAPGFTPPSVP